MPILPIYFFVPGQQQQFSNMTAQKICGRILWTTGWIAFKFDSVRGSLYISYDLVNFRDESIKKHNGRRQQSGQKNNNFEVS